jgi:hypothetical protein
MRINVVQPLSNYNGQILVERDQEGKEKAILLRDLCCVALTANIPNETLVGTEKLKRFVLAQNIFKNDIVELTADDIVLVKKLIDSIYNIVLVGAAWSALENAEPPAAN